MVKGKKYVHCPFKDFDGCCDGSVAGRGLTCPCLLVHLKRHHLVSQVATDRFKKLLSEELVIFKRMNQTLIDAGFWLSGVCMSFHALSKSCRHEDGCSSSPPFRDDLGNVLLAISGIDVPEDSNVLVDIGSRLQGEVYDRELEEQFSLNCDVFAKVLQCSFTTVKSIPVGCRAGFSKALRGFCLNQVIGSPSSVAAWIKLL